MLVYNKSNEYSYTRRMLTQILYENSHHPILHFPRDMQNDAKEEHQRQWWRKQRDQKT
jgi:hypothetical protein